MCFHNAVLIASKIPTRWHRALPARQSSSHRRYLCLICALGPLRSFAISITGTKPSGSYLHKTGLQIPILSVSHLVAPGSPWLPGGTWTGTRGASSPRGPTWDVALLQGAVTAPSSVVSQALADQNCLSSSNKKGTKILDNSWYP